MRHEEEAGEVGVRVRRVRELRELVPEAPRTLRRPALLAQRRAQPRPREARLRDRARRELYERLARLGAEDEERALAVRAHRRGERQVALVVLEGARLERAEVVLAARPLDVQERGLAAAPVPGEDACLQRAEPVGRVAPGDAQAAARVAAEREAPSRAEIDRVAHRPVRYPPHGAERGALRRARARLS